MVSIEWFSMSIFSFSLGPTVLLPLFLLFVIDYVHCFCSMSMAVAAATWNLMRFCHFTCWIMCKWFGIANKGQVDKDGEKKRGAKKIPLKSNNIHRKRLLFNKIGSDALNVRKWSEWRFTLKQSNGILITTHTQQTTILDQTYQRIEELKAIERGGGRRELGKKNTAIAINKNVILQQQLPIKRQNEVFTRKTAVEQNKRDVWRAKNNKSAMRERRAITASIREKNIYVNLINWESIYVWSTMR